MDRIRCERCDAEWQIQDNLSAYEGEIVLACLQCDNRYFNAQEHFYPEAFANLEHVRTKMESKRGTENG